VDAYRLANALPVINNVFTIGSIVCVFPTYFIRLHAKTYRLILSLGIVSGLSIFAITIAILLYFPFLNPELRQYWISIFENCSPFDFVLVAILLCIGRVNHVGFWNTVVLLCVAINWAGVSFILLALQP
jgi:hypothetical protein